MKVRIALAGELPLEQEVQNKLNSIVGELKEYLCKASEDITLQMIISPSYTGETLVAWSQNRGFDMCTYNLQNENKYLEQCTQSVQKDTPIRNIIGDTICDKADSLVVTWNEDVTELSGATWELMKIAYDKKLPCIWVSTKTQKVYCLWDSYYKEYSADYLKAVMVPLNVKEMVPSVSDTEQERFLSYWQKRRAKFMSKFRADNAVHGVQEDFLLNKDYKPEEAEQSGEVIRRILVDKFHSYDDAAIVSNNKFQAMMYQRSVLPFIATIFIAIAFYAETLLGTTLSVMFPKIESAATLSALVIAGFGFLIHGALNLYTYRLSKNQQIQQWQKDYTMNRYVAEILRIFIHFIPYGVSLDIQKLCGQNKELCSYLKHLTDDAEIKEQKLDRKKVQCILKHTKEMIEDQIAYHEASVSRYEKIVNHLDKWAKRITYLGLAIVIGRGALQFGLVVLKALQDVQNIELMNATMISISRSFLNMLALVLPALAGYFATKAQQNNFRYNLNNHKNMVLELNAIREKIIVVMEQNEVPMEVINIMITELTETMILRDSLEWQHQYMNSSIRPL